MKLLLTSSGITTKSIEHAFQDMLNKPFSETEAAAKLSGILTLEK
jgi:hypothetical protein